MDAAEIRRLKPTLLKYLQEYADCFDRKDTRGHLATYVAGQLSKLDRKSVEPIALAAGVAPRTLQQFLNFLEWDQDQLIDILHWRVARDHTSDHSIGILDETACPKKGDKTPGVQRQWCGATGKQDNCVTTVHLGYAVDDFHCLLDSELFLPVSRRAKCARERRVKTSHFEPGIWPMGLLAAMPRKEAQRGEFTQNDRCAIDISAPCARLVQSADRPDAVDQPANRGPVRATAPDSRFKVHQRAD